LEKLEKLGSYIDFQYDFKNVEKVVKIKVGKLE